MANTLKKEKNYWPHAIVIVLIFMIFACIMVVKIAIDNPVQMDSFYFEKYQQVDENINTIKKAQVAFDKNFKINYKTQKFSTSKPNSFEMSIVNLKNKKLIKDAKITLMITRPDTNKYNQEFNLNFAKDGVFRVENIHVSLLGRWQILTKIQIKKYTSFNKYEVYATP